MGQGKKGRGLGVTVSKYSKVLIWYVGQQENFSHTSEVYI